jgi:hypothetical protein
MNNFIANFDNIGPDSLNELINLNIELLDGVATG